MASKTTEVAWEQGDTEIENPPVPYITLRNLEVWADWAKPSSAKFWIDSGKPVFVDKWQYFDVKMKDGSWLQALLAHVKFKNAKGFNDEGWVTYKDWTTGYTLKIDPKAAKAVVDKAKAKPAKKSAGKVYSAPLPSNPYAGESSAAPVALGIGAAALLLWKLWPR